MSMEYIRNTYGVPAKRGAIIEYYSWDTGRNVRGTITSAHGPHIRVRLDGEKRSRIFHPTDESLKYL